MSDIPKMLDDLSGKTLARLCDDRGLRRSGPNDELRERLARSFHGDVDALVELLRRSELIALLENLEFSHDEATGWFRGLRGAELDDLQKLARKVFRDEWLPSKRTEWPLSNSRIRLEWDDGAEDGDADDGDDDDDEDDDEEADADETDDSGDGEERDAADEDVDEEAEDESADRSAALCEWLDRKLQKRGRSSLLVKTLVRKLGRRRASQRLSTVAVREVGEVLGRAGFEMDPDLARVAQSPGIDGRVRISRAGAEKPERGDEPGFRPVPPGPATPPQRTVPPPAVVGSDFEQAANKLQFLVSVAATIAKLDESSRARAVDCAIRGEAVSAADRIRLRALAHQFAGAHGDLTSTIRFLRMALKEDERRDLLADLRTLAPATAELDELLGQYAIELDVVGGETRPVPAALAADGGRPESPAASLQAGGSRENRSLDDIFGRKE